MQRGDVCPSRYRKDIGEDVSTEIQLACFKVGDEKYAADIMKIGEIILYRKITRIPKAPGFIEGIINLRGKVIPVIGMREKLGLNEEAPGRSARIIIIKVGDKDIGIIVDSVLKVLRVEKAEIQLAPAIIKGIESEYLTGVVRDGDELVLILDMEKVLTTAERVRLHDAFHSGKEQEI